MGSTVQFTWLFVGLAVVFLGRGLAAADPSCPTGFYFNTTSDSCVSEDIVDCQRFQISVCPEGTTTNPSKYCLCNRDMHLEILDCPEGTYFDTSRLICRIGTVECQEEYNPFACPGASSNIFFCLCVGGKIQIQYCPAGSVFDAEKEVCLKASSSEPPSSGVSSGKCQRFGLFGDPTDCSGYYHCGGKGDEVVYSKCLAGTIFSLTALGCVAGTC